jgi:hypothetical protein
MGHRVRSYLYLRNQSLITLRMMQRWIWGTAMEVDYMDYDTEYVLPNFENPI